MRVPIAGWTVTRKKIRPSFNLGALGLLFSVSDRVSGPKLSEQDRRDTAYPYRLALTPGAPVNGEYRLQPDATAARPWEDALAGRLWRAEGAKDARVLVTDLTEYERLLWEDLAAQGLSTLSFEPHG